MTIAELNAKRSEILSRLDVVRTSKGDRSIEYRDAEKSLALIDREIARQNRSGNSLSTLATFTKR